MRVFQVYITVMALFIACSGPASGAQRGMIPATLLGLRSATVADMKPPKESPHMRIFFTPAMAPPLTCLMRFSLAWMPSEIAQPCDELPTPARA